MLSYFKVMAAFWLLLEVLSRQMWARAYWSRMAFVKGRIKEWPLSVTAARGSGVLRVLDRRVLFVIPLSLSSSGRIRILVDGRAEKAVERPMSQQVVAVF